ncbi:MAG: hypothetical protein Q9213_000595 [Squamulea squamosa]
MSGASSKATLDLHLETPPHAAHPRTEEPYEELEITFNKTLEGHYRHGKTGYKRVGVLFLTWEEDDMQCKETEVDTLRKLFADEFHYETDYFLIPKDRWQTALQKRIADLFYEYDSPDCLTIIYYGGHGYVGEETHKFEADGSGDPTLFMNDILGCCRLPACDQLLVVDCCSAANAFGPEHIGKRKFEMIVSSGCKGEAAKVPAPLHPGSFTKSLYQVLQKLLQENKTGFVTSQLYREIYHSIPHKVKPWHFDQARRDYGRIWLRPIPTNMTERPSLDEEKAYLDLTLKLNKEPTSIVMNQLALQLQYLPHVDLVRFNKLYAPRRQIEDFMYFVRLATKLRPLVRKIHAKRRLKKLMASLPENERALQRPLSFVALYLDQKPSSACDWSSALDGHNPSPTSPLNSPSSHRWKRSSTWPPVEAQTSKTGNTFSNPFFSLDYKIRLPRTSSIPGLFQLRRVKTIDIAPTSAASVLDFSKYRNKKLALTDVQYMSRMADSWLIASLRSDGLMPVKASDICRPEFLHKPASYKSPINSSNKRPRIASMTAAATMQEGAMPDGASKGMDLGPNKIEWRSRTDPKPPELKEQFTDQFSVNDEVYVNGARGSSGPFKVDQVLGNGRYKLRKQNGEKMKKTYDEGDLSLLPRTIT